MLSCTSFGSSALPTEPGTDATVADSDTTDVATAPDAAERDGESGVMSDPCAADSTSPLCASFENGTCAPFAPQMATSDTVKAMNGDAPDGRFFCRFCPDRSKQQATVVGQALADAGKFSLSLWMRRPVDAGTPTTVSINVDLAGGSNQLASAVTGEWSRFTMIVMAAKPVLDVQLGIAVSNDAGPSPDGCIDFDDVILTPAP